MTYIAYHSIYCILTYHEYCEYYCILYISCILDILCILYIFCMCSEHCFLLSRLVTSNHMTRLMTFNHPNLNTTHDNADPHDDAVMLTVKYAKYEKYTQYATHNLIRHNHYSIHAEYCMVHIPHIVHGERHHVNGKKVPCEQEKGSM